MGKKGMASNEQQVLVRPENYTCILHSSTYIKLLTFIYFLHCGLYFYLNAWFPKQQQPFCVCVCVFVQLWPTSFFNLRCIDCNPQGMRTHTRNHVRITSCLRDTISPRKLLVTIAWGSLKFKRKETVKISAESRKGHKCMCQEHLV